MARYGFGLTVILCFASICKVSDAGCHRRDGSIKPPPDSCNSNTDCTPPLACLGPPGGRKTCQGCPCRDRNQCIYKPPNSAACSCIGTDFTGDNCECLALCPSGWEYYNGSCYLFVNNIPGFTWEESVGKCESLGGHLVSVDSAGENAFIRVKLITTWIPGSPQPFYWIGGRYDTITGDYQWLDGTLIDNNSPFWGPGKPGAIQGCMDYLFDPQFAFNWKWNTDPGCTNIYGRYICELRVHI